MRIAILGTRGVPPRYGGFETFAAELGTRLVKRGHEVAVYCRTFLECGGTAAAFLPVTKAAALLPHSKEWNGIQRIVLPFIPGKYFETVSHSLLSALDAVTRDFDAVLVCNAANAFVLPLLRSARIPVAINVDGIERRRRKWNILGRAVYTVGESFSALFANRVVADADVIAAYYRERFGIEPVTISYGAEFPREEDTDILARLGVERRGYILYVSRFEPENNPLEVVLAYEKFAVRRSQFADGATVNRELRTENPPLVMVGDGAYAPDLVKELRSHESGSVRFPGGVYGADYRTLQRNARVYIQATEVGGTHPALIEAMGAGGCVLAHDTPENREAGGDAVRYFDLRPTETLSTLLGATLADGAGSERMRAASVVRTTERYRWDAVTDAYEALLLNLQD